MTGIFNQSLQKKSPAEWALRYVWNEPGVTSVLSGMNSMEQLQENLHAAREAKSESLSRDEQRMFAILRSAMEAKIKADCTACRYCMPCNSGVDIPDVLAALNSAAMWNDPNPWMTGYTSITGKAGMCSECRDCESVCPQGLEISGFMKEAVSLFKE
jgi:predicted aldo/keto reductase-like oxidoreductase